MLVLGVFLKGVRRIDVKRGESFFVEFSNLSQSDSARVLITNFDKPEVLEVMTKGRVVTRSGEYCQTR